MKQRLYFDVNAGIGRTSAREQRIPYKVESLLDDMRYYRVHGALVHSLAARDYAFTRGNSDMADALQEGNRLFGMAAVIPDIQFELSEGYGYYDSLVKLGVRAFKIYPRSLRHGFDPFSLEKLAEYMVEKRIPLFVDTEEIELRDLRETLAAFPQLKIVLCNSSWGENRDVFSLMARFPNMYFDFSSNQANDILKICKKHFGIERVLYGSNYPNKVMGALKALIEYSGLSDEDKDRVSYKNAVELLRIEPDEIKPYGEEECMLDEIAKKVDLGEPLSDVLVIDAHTHMVDKEHRTTSLVMMLNSDEDNIIRKMDLLGIDRIITSPWEGITTDGISANETSLKAHNRYGNRIEVFATCNPNYKEDLDAVIDVYHEKHRFIGIKPYWPQHKYDLMGEKYAKWFEYGDKNRLIMLVHSGNREIAEKVEKLSGKYRNMTFILAHSGISYDVARWNIDVAKKRENVYLEITYTSLTNGVIEYLVDEVGGEKVLFGSDQPMRDPAPQLAWVAYARISIEDKKKVLGENIYKLIERCYK